MPSLLQTQHFWYDFEWMPSPEPKTLMIIGVVLLAFAVILFTLSIASRHRFRREMEQRKWKRFDKRAISLRLIPAETELIRRMTKYTEDDDPLSVLKSPAFFDFCVESELAATASVDKSQESTDETLSLLASIRRKAGLDFVPQGQFLHSTREIPQNQELHIIARLDGVDREFASSVVRVSEREIMISVPMCDGEGYALDEDTAIEVEFIRNGDAIYRFQSTVERNFGSRLPLIFITHSSDIERIQLRCFYRIEADLPIKYRTISADHLDNPIASFAGVEEWREGRINNISGGGARIELSEKISFDDFINFDVSLDKGRTNLNLTAEIINIVPIDANKCTAHTAFVGITEINREKVVKFVFRQQIDYIRSEQSEIEAARKRRFSVHAKQ